MGNLSVHVCFQSLNLALEVKKSSRTMTLTKLKLFFFFLHDLYISQGACLKKNKQTNK